MKRTLVHSYKSRFLQSLEKSPHQKPLQQAKTCSHWNNRPAKNVVNIPKTSSDWKNPDSKTHPN